MALEPATLAQLKPPPPRPTCIQKRQVSPHLCNLLAHSVGSNPSPKGFLSGLSRVDCHPDFRTLWALGSILSLCRPLSPSVALCLPLSPSEVLAWSSSLRSSPELGCWWGLSHTSGHPPPPMYGEVCGHVLLAFNHKNQALG